MCVEAGDYMTFLICQVAGIVISKCGDADKRREGERRESMGKRQQIASHNHQFGISQGYGALVSSLLEMRQKV
jgi:hypothetical protein